MGKILFWAVFFFAYTLQAVTGFAGNILAMPVGISTIGMTESLCVLNITGCLACGLVAALDYKHIVWRELAIIVPVMLVFMVLGVWIDAVLPLGILRKVYAVFILAVAVRNLFFPSTKKTPAWAMWLALALAGVIQGMFVSGGAMLVIYAAERLKDKNEFRATLSMVWAILNALYALYNLYMGHMTGDVALVVSVCIPLFALATLAGNVVYRRMTQASFLKLTHVVLLVVAVVMLFS